MTEAEWLGCVEPRQMLFFLGSGSARKTRLLMVAACRRGEHHLDDPEYVALLDAVERVAEGKLSPASLARYRTNCPPVPFGDQQLWQADSEKVNLSNISKHAVWLSGGKDFRYLEICLLEAAQGVHRRQTFHKGLRDQCQIVRDIFGNPFRPVAFSAEWRTSTVVLLAKQMYESRDFSTMPILADALQDAGCDNADVLNHCREANGVHVRGCWVVDGVLGKT